MINIILHGDLRDQYESFPVAANTVAEAIEGWSRQTTMGDLPLDKRPVIDVLGFDTPDTLFAKTDVKEIHLVPRMFGGGGKFGQILIGAALIAAAIVLPEIGVALSTAVQSALIASGIGMVIGGVMQLFMPTPTVSKSNDPDASKYISGVGNTTAIGTLIPKGYGRFIMGGQYLSVQVNAQDMVLGQFPVTP